MHAPCYTANASDIECPRSTMRERVEDAELDVLVRIEDCQAGIVSAQLDVVDQQTDAHAPVRGAEQGIDKYAAHEVAVNQEILCVDTALRPFGHEQPQ